MTSSHPSFDASTTPDPSVPSKGSRKRLGLSPRRRLPAEKYDEIKTRARELYLIGVSYREIAERVGLSESGYVQVARWVKQYGWAAERSELEAKTKLQRRTNYITRVSVIQEAHLNLAAKVRHIAMMALDGYVEKDENGDIIGVKTNPRTGLPAITPYALQQMIVGSAELERKALGFELLPQQAMEEASTSTVVDATPEPAFDDEMRRRIGDFLAAQSLVVDALPTPVVLNPEADQLIRHDDEGRQKNNRPDGE